MTVALTQQGFSFADQVADDVRARSRRVDGRLERAARRLLRRRTPDGAGPATSAEST